MSFIGEYVETPYLRHLKEGDPYLKEFRSVRHFPTLRSNCTRARHTVQRDDDVSLNSEESDEYGGSVKHTRTMARQAHAKAARRAAPPSEAAMRRSFRKSLITDAGALSEFRGTLIRDKLEAKAGERAKTKLSQSVESLEKQSKLTNSDVTVRAMAKLEYFAKDFDPDKCFARTFLKGFTGRKMTAPQFQEQLVRSLNLRLSGEEVHAIMNHFDNNNDGYIECHEFVSHFFSAAFRRRSEERSAELNKSAMKEKEARDAKKAAEAAEEAANFRILTFDYTADDLRRALEYMAHVAQWWDFQSYRDKIFLEPFMTQMTPLQFQLQLKQSFGVVTTEGEMAALCRFFDTDGDGFVDGPELLRGFFKMQHDFHECVADRVNSDNKNRAKYLESLFEKRVPTKQRSPANPLRKPQMPKAVTPMATNFLRDFSMRASSIDEAKLSPSNSLSQRGQQAEERRVSLQPLQEAEDIQGDKAALRSPKNSNRSSETPTLERTSSNRCESTKKEADSIVDTPLATSCGNAPNTRRPSCKLSYLEGFESGCVSPLGGSSPVPSAKPAKTRRASVAEMMGKASRPKTPIVNQLPFPPDRNQEPCSGGGLISHRSSNSGVASSEVKLKPLGGERHKLQDAVLAAVAPTRKGAIEKVNLSALKHGHKLDFNLFGIDRPRPPNKIEVKDVLKVRQKRSTTSQKWTDLSNAVDAEGFSMDDNKVDAWGRPLLSDSKLRKLQTKMQAALLGTDPQKFLERYDSDGGGSLDSSELKKVVRGLMKVGRKDLSDQELSAFVNNLDDDGSGSLEFNEILAFVQPSMAMRSRAEEAASRIQGVHRRRLARKNVEARKEMLNKLGWKQGMPLPGFEMKKPEMKVKRIEPKDTLFLLWKKGELEKDATEGDDANERGNI